MIHNSTLKSAVRPLFSDNEATSPPGKDPEVGNDDRTVRGQKEANQKRKKESIAIPPLYLEHARHIEKVLTISFGLTRRCSEKLALHWVNLELPSIEKALKWLYASLFSTCLDQELPSNPYPEKIQGLYSLLGPFKGFVKGIVRSTLSRTRSKDRRRRDVGLARAEDLLFAKKGSPVVSEELVNSSKKTHKESLTKRVDRPEQDGRDILTLVVCKKIDEILDDVFGYKRFKPTPTPKFPSLNSSSVSYEKGKGIKSAPMAQVIYEQKIFKRPTLDPIEVRIRPLVRHYEDTFDRDDYRLGDPWVFNFSPLERQNWERQFLRMFYHPRLGVQTRYLPDWECELPDLTAKVDFLAKPAFVLEPLKVRPIMMGPGIEYFELFQLQSYLWSRLKVFDTFCLIGEPCTPEKLEEIYVKKIKRLAEQGELLPDSAHHSGDYESATDRFIGYFSRYISDGISFRGQLGPHFRRLMAMGLVGHKISYDDQTWCLLRQSNGQSMGSPVSFPILCIFNAALCAVAHDSKRDWSLPPIRWYDLPMCINGDDCLNFFSRKQKEEWERICGLMGLKPSVGKTYYSQWFAQINSQCFSFGEGFEDLRQVDYINYCMLSSHDARGSSERHWSALPACLQRWYKSTKGRMSKPQALTYFLSAHAEKLKQVPQGMSWWLPETLGGLGLEWDGENLPDITYLQRRRATYLHNFYEEGERPSLPPRTWEMIPFAQSALRRIMREEWMDTDTDSQEIDVLDTFSIKTGLKGMAGFLWEEFLERDQGRSAFKKPQIDDDRAADLERRYNQSVFRKMVKLEKECDWWEREWEKSFGCKSPIGLAPVEALLKFSAAKRRVNPSICEALSSACPRVGPALWTELHRLSEARMMRV